MGEADDTVVYKMFKNVSTFGYQINVEDENALGHHYLS